MQTVRKNQTDVIFLFELTPLIGICYENILETYIKPLITHFYGLPLNDDIGIIKDMNGAIFSAIGYKSLDCTPLSFCDLIQPTSHAKLFYEKLENVFEFAYGANDDKSHMAEGLALALDTFEELNKKRNNQTRHVILVSSLNPYEDVPVFESKTYSNMYFEEILQNLQKQQIHLSIISPKFSNDLIKLYEKVNGGINGEFKLEKLNNINYFSLLHKNIQLENYETQQQQQQQTQQHIPIQASQNINLNPLSNKIEPQTEYYQPQSIKMETNENVGTPLSNQNYQMNQQINNQNPASNNPQSNAGMMNQQYQQQPPQQQTQQQMQINQPPQQQQQQQQAQMNYRQNSPMQPVQTMHQSMVTNPAQNEIYSQPQQQTQTQSQIQPKQIQHPQQMHPMNPQQQQQQQPQQTSQQAQPTQQMNMNPNQQGLMQQQLQQQRMQQISQQVNPNQQPIQHGMNQNPNQIQQPQIMRQPTPQQIQPQPSPQQPIIQPHTPPVTNPPMNQQQQQQQQQQQMMMQNYGMTPSPVNTNTSIYGQQSGQVQQPVQQSNQQNYNYIQQAQIKLWGGQIEWQEKDRNNPNNPNKVTHTVKASILCNNIKDPNTGQYQPDLPITTAQMWPPKISIQLLSKQILEILSQQCPPSAKTLFLNAEESMQDLKTALSIGGGLIHLNNQALEIKLFLVINQGNEIVCKVPSDQNKFLNALKQIIQRQKMQQQQQQQQQQQPHIQQQIIMQQQHQQQQQQQQQQPIQHIITQQQPQRTMMNNPGMMQQPMQVNQSMMSQQQPNQVIIQGGQQMTETGKDLRNLLNVPNQSMGLAQQQQQQQQQKMQMQQPNQQTWMNQPQAQQQHIQQQPNQIYMANQSNNMAQQQQQQKPNQNFQFYDNYNQ